MRHAVFEVAVDKHLFNVFQTIEQTLLQSFGFGQVLRHFEFGNAKGLTHAHTLVCGQSATAHAAFVTATVHLRFQAHARFATHIQSANAFGAVGFVRGQAHQVDRQGLQIDLNFASRLRRVHMEHDAFFATQRTNACNVLHHTDFVVHMHDADQNRVGANGGFQHIHVQHAVFLHIEVGHFKTLTLEFTHGVEHRFVLGFHGDEVLAA